LISSEILEVVAIDLITVEIVLDAVTAFKSAKLIRDLMVTFTTDIIARITAIID